MTTPNPAAAALPSPVPQPVASPSAAPPPAADPPLLAGERESLDAWLEYFRAAVLRKIDGLSPEQLARRPIPPSPLSPLGLVRHLGAVEAYWLREVLWDDEQPDPYCAPENPDGDHLDGTAESAPEDLEIYRAQVAAAREAQAEWEDLDLPVRGDRGGAEVNLRWILTHLIEEYARHLGHLDLLCEVIDGRTGE